LVQAIIDKIPSISICGIGTEGEELNKKGVARIIIETCRKFTGKIKVRIIDDNKEFIDNVKEILENY
jgi:hypothetical protein